MVWLTNKRKVVTAGRDTGATSKEFGEYLMATVEDANVEKRWEEFVNAKAGVRD